MNDILIVPDVHGRRFWEPVLNYPGQIVFLGDYLDPYPSEGITPDDAYSNFCRIVAFKMENPERVTLLVGNHELHYYDHKYECTRFSARHYVALHEILTSEKTRNLFQVCKQVDQFLFSHAGALKSWYDRHHDKFAPLGITLEEQMNRYFRTAPDAFGEISALRRGQAASGSPLWADIHEHFDEPEPFVSDIIQIIGHTQMENEEAYIEGNICLVDNRKLYVINNEMIKCYENP